MVRREEDCTDTFILNSTNRRRNMITSLAEHFSFICTKLLKKIKQKPSIKVNRRLKFIKQTWIIPSGFIFQSILYTRKKSNISNRNISYRFARAALLWFNSTTSSGKIMTIILKQFTRNLCKSNIRKHLNM